MKSPSPPAFTPPDPGEPATRAAPRRRRGGWQVVLTLIGIVLLVLCAWWWFETLQAWRLVLGDRTRIPGWRFLGLDFLHNYRAARLWLDGGNPYVDDFGDWRKEYAYPPVVLPLYWWCRFVGEQLAVVIWMAVVAAVVAAGAWVARRVRSNFGLAPLPLVFMIAAALCSMPVLFAMERGQGDVVILMMILIIAAVLQRPATWGRDILIGVCLALATWTKVYPVVLLLGLAALGVWRAAGMTVLQVILIGVVPYRVTKYWFASTAASQGDRIGFVSEVFQWLTNRNHKPAQLSLFPPISVDSHSLTTYWATFWNHFDLPWLARMPGVIGAAAVLVPLALLITVCVRRSPARTALAYPYLLLLAALATFGLPVSYDYNLIYLPLAALAVCDRRDPPIVAIALAGMLVWWQPFRVPWEMQVASAFALFGAEPPLAPFEMLLRVERDVLFFLKLFAAVGVGISLIVRAKEAEVVDPAGLSAPLRQPAPLA